MMDDNQILLLIVMMVFSFNIGFIVGSVVEISRMKKHMFRELGLTTNKKEIKPNV